MLRPPMRPRITPDLMACVRTLHPQAHSAMRSMGYVRYAQKAISASQAKSIAAKRVRGAKFVDISRSGGKYRVRMLRKDGRVVDVLIDAATGRVLN